MRAFDRLLESWRARAARPWIPEGSQVLDIGCLQGQFLHDLGDRIGPSIGLDPLASPRVEERYEILAMAFEEPSSFPDFAFDAIVMLATLEHIIDKEPLARECYRLLRPDGRLIITVPSPLVDRIMDLLCRLRVADGMSLEQHHGFDPRTTPQIFECFGFALEHTRRFELGLNHLFVFRKPACVTTPTSHSI
jgi:SAM-dependent methyltransferase